MSRNENVSVPNIYKLYDLNREFVQELEIKTPNYEVVSLLEYNGRYYVRSGGNWRLYETPCWTPEGKTC